MLDHSTPVSWVLSLRCDELTQFFKIFPFFVSDTFFILFIAIGFWRRRHALFFLDLILLVCLTTILNNGLKGFFSIPRPDPSYHLLPLMDPWGFPSGDVQQSVVFWGALWAYFRTPLWALLALFMIPLVMISRLYLGVHSGYDVLAGLGIGLITIGIYRGLTLKNFLSAYFIKKPIYFWTTLASFSAVYLLTCPKDAIPIMIPLSTGALIGYGISLYGLSHNSFQRQAMADSKEYFALAVSLFIVILASKLIPSFSFLPLIYKYPLLMAKMTFMVWLILILIPKILQKFSFTQACDFPPNLEQ